ncbi:hypothetical protein ILUMI_09768 [Ignelater luminosus]|uniref:Uncharacterized protein n=1 Tax=Ignelater luminosus TaxID=2038154 RepID=A0A8K0D3L5_IGNLU|nr:hypothetical protein ILUMI_09768 [Ignelater luminosus]
MNFKLYSSLAEYTQNRGSSGGPKLQDFSTLDIFNRLLISSDPLITSLQKLPTLRSKSFDPDVCDMLTVDLDQLASTSIHDLQINDSDNSD